MKVNGPGIVSISVQLLKVKHFQCYFTFQEPFAHLMEVVFIKLEHSYF